MDISVIVPIFGVERYIERSLVSLFTQSKCDGVEFILVNDCTKDRSMDIAIEVISRYPNLDIKVVEHKENRGLASARLSGIKIAQGRYIQHVDSDDWCEPKMLEELFNFAVSNDADVVGCDYIISYQKRERYIKHPIPSNYEQAYRQLIVGSIQHAVWIKFAKRTIYTENNITVNSKDLCQWEDLVFATQIFYYSKKIFYLPKAYIHYQQNMDSISKTVSTRHISDIINALSEVTSFAKANRDSIDCNLELNYRTLMAYQAIISVTRGKDQKKYAKMMPAELEHFIWSHPSFRFYNKMVTFFAYNNLLILSNFILNSITFVKRLLKRAY